MDEEFKGLLVQFIELKSMTMGSKYLNMRDVIYERLVNMLMNFYKWNCRKKVDVKNNLRLKFV